MSRAQRMAGCLLWIPAALCAAQSPNPPAKTFESQYMTISVLPGWTIDRSSEPELKLARGKFILTIDPMKQQTGGAPCGRFAEITSEMRSVGAVMAGVDQPAGGWECSPSPRPGALSVNKAIALKNLYSGGPNTKDECRFPRDGHPVWFGSYLCAMGSYGEYTITLAYDTEDVNQLPENGSRTLQQVFRDSIAMLRTLHLKPPVIITRIAPSAARPGEQITIYGSGFRIRNEGALLFFGDFPGNPIEIPASEIAEDGSSFSFQVPAYVNSSHCRDASICAVPVPAGDQSIRVGVVQFISAPATLRVLAETPR